MSTDTLVENQNLEKLIKKAQEKVNAVNTNGISKYLPNNEGFQMHHFAMQKIWKEDPNQLRSLVEEFIINAPTPKIVNPKPRAPRIRSVKSLPLSLENAEVMDLLELARKNNKTELAEKLQASLPVDLIKKELIQVIQEENVDAPLIPLWHAFISAVKRKNIEAE